MHKNTQKCTLKYVSYQIYIIIYHLYKNQIKFVQRHPLKQTNYIKNL